MKTNHVLFIVLASLVLASCTVQKRVHRKGWFVQWHFDKKDSQKQHESSNISDDNTIDSSSVASKTVSVKEKQSRSVPSSSEDDLLTEDAATDATHQFESKTDASDEAVKSSAQADPLPQNEGRNPGFFVPIITLIASTIAGILVISSVGLSPLAVPIILSAVFSLFFFFVLKKIWSDFPEAIARRKIQNNIILMFVFFAIAFAIALIYTAIPLPHWIIISLMILTILTLVLVIINQKKNGAPAPSTVEEETENSQEEFPVSPPLTKMQVFPNLYGSIALCLILSILLAATVFLLAAFASFIGVAIGPLFYIGCGAVFLLLNVTLFLYIKLDKAYSQYLEDLRQEQPEKRDASKTENQKDTAPAPSSNDKTRDKSDIRAGIFIAAVVTLVTILVLLQ